MKLIEIDDQNYKALSELVGIAQTVCETKEITFNDIISQMILDMLRSQMEARS